MNTLNLGSDEIPATKKKSNTRNLKIALGLAAVILVPTIGSTLAGTITVSGADNEVEFAQGFVTTAACDTEIDVSPNSSVDSAGVFYLASIVIDGVDPTTCDEKYFTIRVLNANSPTPSLEQIGTTETSCKFQFVTATPSIIAASGGNGCTVVADSSTATGFTIAPYGATAILATDVRVITIESSLS